MMETRANYGVYAKRRNVLKASITEALCIKMSSPHTQSYYVLEQFSDATIVAICTNKRS